MVIDGGGQLYFKFPIKLIKYINNYALCVFLRILSYEMEPNGSSMHNIFALTSITILLYLLVNVRMMHKIKDKIH